MGKDWDSFKPGAVARDTTDERQAAHRPTAKGAQPFGYSHGQGSDHAANAAMQSWHESWAREAYRVLKPGGHLLAFGGSRTYHRLACAVEDAGFEIRDQLQWLYGSGFPKSHDVSKAMDKRRDDTDPVLVVTRWLNAEIKRADVRYADILRHFGFNDGSGQVGHWTALSLGAQPAVPQWDQWLALKDLLGFSEDMDAEVWRLNGRKGQPGEAWYEREAIGEGTYAARRPRAGAGVTIHMPSAADETAPATDLARQWDGWGTALKPAHEPIVLARKPLTGTVAANVTAHGTGALNIGATRIGITDGAVMARQNKPGANGWMNSSGGPNTAAIHGEPSGRWPSNVLLGHSPECREVGVKRVKGNGHHPSARGTGGLGTSGHTGQDGLDERNYRDETVTTWECAPDCAVALLDAQSGERRSAGQYPSEARTSGIFGDRIQGALYSDSGGPSRFFYTAKASRAERNAGLDGMPERMPDNAIDRATQRQGLEGASGRGSLTKPMSNHHPCVKPIALMRWLVRLICPPNGTILDPFAGSGSTGIAAILEGFDFIGVEQDAEYLAIARARIAHVEKHGENWLTAGRVASIQRRKPAAQFQSRKRQCNVCGCATGPHGHTEHWPTCGHDDWRWVEKQNTVVPEKDPSLDYGPLFAQAAD
jgi:hypothetical protein